MSRYLFLIVLLVWNASFVRATELGIHESRFTIDGKPAFLLGISYYGGLGAPERFVDQDLDDMQRDGFNWLRIWGNWAAFDTRVAAVDVDGSAREPYLTRLKELVAACDKRGMIVDVTLSRGNGVAGPPRLQKPEEHLRAVETLVQTLKPYRNWYLDLGNERSIKDSRFVPHETLKVLRDRAKELDPKRLITASHASGDEEFVAELEAYVKTTRVDFVSPHRIRTKATAGQTEAMTRRYLTRLKELGVVVPVHYQEPFRRGFGDWDPEAEDFLGDLRGAIKGGAAGWCFHNGDQRKMPDGKPRRSFDLRERRLYEQLDEVERPVVKRLKAVMNETASTSRIEVDSSAGLLTALVDASKRAFFGIILKNNFYVVRACPEKAMPNIRMLHNDGVQGILLHPWLFKENRAAVQSPAFNSKFVSKAQAPGFVSHSF